MTDEVLLELLCTSLVIWTCFSIREVSKGFPIEYDK